MRDHQPPLRVDFKITDVFACILQKDKRDAFERIHTDLAVAYSVRTLWLTLLESLALKPGDEIILSAINILQMADIVRALSLKPIVVDIDPIALLPRVEDIEKLVTKRTKAVLIAHLFGTWSDLEAHAQVCRKRNIVLVEDCAQCFMGPEFNGSPSADLTFFSFGNIKRSSAAGGGICALKSELIPAVFVNKLENYSEDSSFEFLKKVAKASVLALVTHRLAYSIFYCTLRIFANDPIGVLREYARGFKSSEESNLKQYRRALHPIHKRLIQRKWMEGFDFRAADRTEFKIALEKNCPNPHHLFPGNVADVHTYWLFPIRVSDTDRISQMLVEQNFHVTRGLTSLRCLDDTAENASNLFESMIYLCVDRPTDPDFFKGILCQVDYVKAAINIEGKGNYQCLISRPTDY
ncbi:MAG: aminotransferase class V-fold PLP-dependent enzyme [Oligoflexales bacterium]